MLFSIASAPKILKLWTSQPVQISAFPLVQPQRLLTTSVWRCSWTLWNSFAHQQSLPPPKFIKVFFCYLELKSISLEHLSRASLISDFISSEEIPKIP